MRGSGLLGALLALAAAVTAHTLPGAPATSAPAPAPTLDEGPRPRHWAHRARVAAAVAAALEAVARHASRSPRARPVAAGALQAGGERAARVRGAGARPLGAGAAARGGGDDDPAHAAEEEERSCWQDADCALYPPCREGRPACRCQPWGTCLLLRLHGERCSDDGQCAGRMVCNDTAGAGSRSCSCGEGARYSRALASCIAMPDFLTDPPRFADLPDLDRGDEELPAIPATYVGPYLVGFISLGLVLGCLLMALWCRFSGLGEPPCGVRDPSKSVLEGAAPDAMPLDLYYVPPPKMYRTPGCLGEEAAAAAGPARRGVLALDLGPRPYPAAPAAPASSPPPPPPPPFANACRLNSRNLHTHSELVIPERRDRLDRRVEELMSTPGAGCVAAPTAPAPHVGPAPPAARPPPQPPPRTAPPSRLTAEQWATLAALLTPAERRTLEGLLTPRGPGLRPEAGQAGGPRPGRGTAASQPSTPRARRGPVAPVAPVAPLAPAATTAAPAAPFVLDTLCRSH